MRALVVKMSSLGDVIHTLPALTDAREALPGIRFDWAVEEGFAEIPAWHPAVEQVIPVALRRWRKHPLKSLRGPEWQRARGQLRSSAYDAVIDAQGLMKSALIAGQVNAPRYGMDWRTARERMAATVYHHRIEIPREMHAVERIRLLFSRALDYPRPAGRGDYGIRPQLETTPSQPGRGILLFHGSARPEKLWPEEHWVGLGALAVADGFVPLLPWGNEIERDRARRIAGRLDSAEVLPRLNLCGLAQSLLRASGAVAVDTGLGHLAAALDVPTVSLYGPTRSRLVGAYGQNQVHIESPAALGHSGYSQSVMPAITVARVWSELQALIRSLG